jgi:hypothetical protein
MRYLIVLLILAPLAAATEELPDSADLPEERDAESMQDRFPAPTMDSGEMESLFLESPVELGNPDERSGMESMSDEDRFRESDLFFRERRQSESLDRAKQPDTEPQVPNPPLRAPLEEL